MPSMSSCSSRWYSAAPCVWFMNRWYRNEPHQGARAPRRWQRDRNHAPAPPPPPPHGNRPGRTARMYTRDIPGKKRLI